MSDRVTAARNPEVRPAVRARVYVALCTIALAQPLLQIYGGNLAVFTAAHYSGMVVVWFAAFVVVVPPAVVFGVDVTLSRIPGVDARIVHLVLVQVCAWSVTALLMRSFTTGHWPIDVALSCAAAAVITLAYARRESVRSWLSWMSFLSVVVVVIFVNSAMPVISPPRVDAEAAQTPGGAATASVVWIVLDEAPLFPLLGSDGNINARRFPGFAALGSVSTWYRNVVATSQKTTDAVPAMLEGRWPGDKGQPTLGDHPRNLFTAVGGAMKMDVSESVTAMCPAQLCDVHGESQPGGVVAAPSRSRVPFMSFVRDAAIVVGHKLLPEGLRRRLPPIDEGWGEFGSADDTTGGNDATDGNDTTTGEATAGTANPPVRSGHAGRVGTLRSLISNAASSSSPTLHFAHVLLPHKPWTLAPDLRMSARPDTDPRPITSVDRRRDAYQSHLRQFVAVDSVIGDLVNTIKSSGNWDSTMIVVTADHGLTFVPGESYRDAVNVENPPTLDDIYRVPLFVKFPHQAKGDVNDCPVSSVDILPTVLAAAGVRTMWTFDGVDLAGKCPERTSRTIRWPKGQFDLATGVNELRARVAYYGKWVDPDGDTDDIVRGGLSGSLVGTRVPAAPAEEKSISWRLDNASAFASISNGEFGSVPTRAIGTVRTGAGVPRTTEGLIEVDGTFVGVVSELAGLGSGGSTYFSAPLQTSLLAAGPHSVRLWTASWENGSATLRLVGDPA